MKDMTPAQAEAILEKNATKTVTHKFLTGLLGSVVAEVAKQIAQQQKRIDALEAKPSIKFCGTFAPGTTYSPGDACVHKSALWICKAATSGAPGTDFIGWQLAVKRGEMR